MKFIKNNSMVFVFIFFQFLTFILIKPEDLESFYMIWGIIFFFLFLYDIFNVTSDGSIGDIGGGNSGNAGVSNSSQYSAMAQIMFSKGEEKDKSSGIFNRVNLTFLLLAVLNIVFYIIVMSR